MLKTRRTVRALRANGRALWDANRKLRKRVYQLEEHTKHVETKLTKLNTYNKIQVM